MVVKNRLGISFFVFLGFFFMVTVSGSTINDTVFFSVDSNSTIFVNETITFVTINLTDDWLEIYNLTGGGNFTNINETYDAYLHLFELANADINYSNATQLTGIAGDYNITLGVGEYMHIYNNYSEVVAEEEVTVPSDSPSGSGSGSSGSSSPSVNTSVKDTNQTFNTSELMSLRILNDEICTIGGILRFKPLDQSEIFILINETEIFINDSKKSFKVNLNESREYYYVDLDELKEGTLEIKIIVSLNGHIEQALKSLNIITCDDSEATSNFEILVFLGILGTVLILLGVFFSKKIFPRDLTQPQ